MRAIDVLDTCARIGYRRCRRRHRRRRRCGNWLSFPHIGAPALARIHPHLSMSSSYIVDQLGNVYLIHGAIDGTTNVFTYDRAEQWLFLRWSIA